MLDELPQSGSVPAFGWPDFAQAYGPALQFDDGGNLWVVEYHMTEEDKNSRSVFDRTDVWLGSVDLPQRFAPHHIGVDFVLGVWRDEMDVEHVHLYELIKPGE